MSLTEEERREFERELDDIARKMPKWQEHLADFRKRHPELSPQDVMRKAGFTFRMKKGKLIKGWIKKLFDRITEEVMKDEEEKGV